MGDGEISTSWMSQAGLLMCRGNWGARGLGRVIRGGPGHKRKGCTVASPDLGLFSDAREGRKHQQRATKCSFGAESMVHRAQRSHPTSAARSAQDLGDPDSLSFE